MNWTTITKNFIAMCLIYATCAASSLHAKNYTERELLNSEAYLEGRYDEEHQKGDRSYLLSRKKAAYLKGREDVRNGKPLSENRMLALKLKARQHYYAKQSSAYHLYDHGPMYGNPNIPCR